MRSLSLDLLRVLSVVLILVPEAFSAQPAPTVAPTSTAPASGGTAPASAADSAPAKPKFGERTTLQQDGKSFAAVYAEATSGKAKGAVLMVPDLNRAPDVPGVVYAFGTSLPRSGWSILSLELPGMPPDSPRNAYGKELEAASKRVQAGLEFLRSKQVPAIVVLGHGLGATIATTLLAKGPANAVVGLAAVGWDLGDDLLPAIGALGAVEKLTTPVLDIYGSRDFDRVRNQAEQRRIAVRKAQPSGYTRVEVKDANHEFTGLELFLVNRVRGWMERLQAARPQAAPGEPPANAKP